MVNLHKKPVIIAAVAVVAVLGATVCAVRAWQSKSDSESVKTETVDPMTPESPWTFYGDNSRFTFWAPQSLEARQADSPATSESERIVLQQAGLNDKKADAFRTYARIIFIYTPMSGGRHTFASAEDRPLDDEARRQLHTLALRESAARAITHGPEYGRMLIGDTRALYVTYTRQGGEGPVCNTIYQLCNDTESVEIITSYRAADSTRWGADLRDVIRTFRWTQPQ